MPNDSIVIEIDPLTEKSLFFCLGEGGGELVIYSGPSVKKIDLVGDRINCLLVLQGAVAKITDRIKSELAEAIGPAPEVPKPADKPHPDFPRCPKFGPIHAISPCKCKSPSDCTTGRYPRDMTKPPPHPATDISSQFRWPIK